MANLPSARTQSVGLFVAAAIVLAGCNTSKPSPADGTAGRSSGAVALDQVLTFPLDAYANTVPQQHQVALARNLLVGRCLQQIGFQFDAAVARTQARQREAAEMMDAGLHGNNRRYSVIDMTAATKYGYHPPSVASGTRDQVDRGDAHGLGTDLRTNAAKRSAATDCTNEADRKLYPPKGHNAGSDLIEQLSADSFNRSLTDPSVLAAFKNWSTCMSGNGYHLVDPEHLGSGYDNRSPRPSPAEIAQARADVACKQKAHVVEVWQASEVKRQKAAIAQHLAELRQARTANDAAVKLATTVIDGGQ